MIINQYSQVSNDTTSNENLDDDNDDFVEEPSQQDLDEFWQQEALTQWSLDEEDDSSSKDEGDQESDLRVLNWLFMLFHHSYESWTLNEVLSEHI